MLETPDLYSLFAFSFQERDGKGRKRWRRNKKETDDEMATVAVSFKPEGTEREREKKGRDWHYLRKLCQYLSQVESRNEDERRRYEITGIKGRVKSWLPVRGRRVGIEILLLG